MDFGKQQGVIVVPFIKQLFHTNILLETPSVGYVVISWTIFKFLVKFKSHIKKYWKDGRIYQKKKQFGFGPPNLIPRLFAISTAGTTKSFVWKAYLGSTISNLLLFLILSGVQVNLTICIS